jgi:hypothetical protein
MHIALYRPRAGKMSPIINLQKYLEVNEVKYFARLVHPKVVLLRIEELRVPGTTRQAIFAQPLQKVKFAVRSG